MDKKKNVLEQSIEEKMEASRYEVPKEKKKKRRMDFQLILVIGVLLGLIGSLLRLFM